MVMDSVSCIVEIPKSQLTDFQQTEESQLAVIDLSNVKKGENKLVPTIKGLPGNARLVQVDSVTIRLY